MPMMMAWVSLSESFRKQMSFMSYFPPQVPATRCKFQAEVTLHSSKTTLLLQRQKNYPSHKKWLRWSIIYSHISALNRGVTLDQTNTLFLAVKSAPGVPQNLLVDLILQVPLCFVNTISAQEEQAGKASWLQSIRYP